MLMFERRYIFQFSDILHQMNHMGLLSIGMRDFKEKEQVMNHMGLLSIGMRDFKEMEQVIMSPSKEFGDIVALKLEKYPTDLFQIWYMGRYPWSTLLLKFDTHRTLELDCFKIWYRGEVSDTTYKNYQWLDKHTHCIRDDTSCIPKNVEKLSMTRSTPKLDSRGRFLYPPILWNAISPCLIVRLLKKCAQRYSLNRIIHM